MFLFQKYKETNIYLFYDNNMYFTYDIKSHKMTNKFTCLDELREHLRINSKDIWNK